MKVNLKLLFSALIAIISLTTNAIAQSDQKPDHQKPVVNILTWWGYLNNKDIIRNAEKVCNVKISYDEYFSNDAFLRRWRSQKDLYDIIIFSKTIYNILENDVKNVNKSSSLWKQSSQYHPVIKKNYLNSQFPPNVVYFFHSLTGFLYNPNVISISGQDSISAIFQKSNDNLVVIVDDPLESRKLINSENDDSMFAENFRKISQQAKVYIGNGSINIYKSPKFSFAYIWSGEALQKISGDMKEYKFLIHPDFSYLSSDLLAQISQKKESECVSNYLTSKPIVSKMQNENFYFTSYTDSNGITDPNFAKAYQQFISMLPTIKWVETVFSKDFNSISLEWELIKLEMLKKRQ